MDVRAPFEHFIRYLVSLGHNVKEVKRTLKIYGFPEISDKYFARVRSEVDLPPDFVGRDRRHAPSIQCLRRNAIAELWFKEEFPYVEKAFDILGKPAIRRIVDTLAATPATFDEIALALRERLGVEISSDTIMFYTRIFCNYGLMTPDELRQYARENGEIWRQAAMDGDVDLLRYHLGLDINLKVGDVIKEVFQLGVMKLRELKHKPNTLESAKSYGEYMKGIQWSAEQLQGSQDKLGELTKALTMTYDEGKDPRYTELLPSPVIRAVESGGKEEKNAAS